MRYSKLKHLLGSNSFPDNKYIIKLELIDRLRKKCRFVQSDSRGIMSLAEFSIQHKLTSRN